MNSNDPKPLMMAFLMGKLEELEIELKAKKINSRQVTALVMDKHFRSMRLFYLIKADPNYSSHPSTDILFAAHERLDRQLQLGIYEHVPNIVCGNLRIAKRHLELLQFESAKLAGIEVIND